MLGFSLLTGKSKSFNLVGKERHLLFFCKFPFPFAFFYIWQFRIVIFTYLIFLKWCWLVLYKLKLHFLLSLYCTEFSQVHGWHSWKLFLQTRFLSNLTWTVAFNRHSQTHILKSLLRIHFQLRARHFGPWIFPFHWLLYGIAQLLVDFILWCFCFVWYGYLRWLYLRWFRWPLIWSFNSVWITHRLFWLLSNIWNVLDWLLSHFYFVKFIYVY